MNSITIVGNIGKEPELRYTKNQMAVLEFTVAVKSGKDDKQKTTWFSVKMFGDLAENVAKTVTKGDSVIVQGRMEADEYTKKDGNKSSWTYLIADNVGPSCRWNAWVKDASEKVMAKAGSVGRPMPATRYDDEEPAF